MSACKRKDRVKPSGQTQVRVLRKACLREQLQLEFQRQVSGGKCSHTGQAIVQDQQVPEQLGAHRAAQPGLKHPYTILPGPRCSSLSVTNDCLFVGICKSAAHCIFGLSFISVFPLLASFQVSLV